MRGLALALGCALAFGAWLAPAPVRAADTLLHVLLDDRPVDANSPSALLHRGTAFINVVRATKAFSGVLIFGKDDRSVRVTIRSRTASFVPGRRAGTMDGEATVFPAAPFALNGDIYVPLASFAKLAGAELRVEAKHGVARLTTSESK